MADELDGYEEDMDAEEDRVAELDEEQLLADAEELLDLAGERDHTPFDETRFDYSGIAEGETDVDVEEYEEAGALFDDPEQA